MTTGHVFIACSLDGYIARPDGAIDWLSGTDRGDGTPGAGGEDFGYGAFIERMDGIIMGRATYQTVLDFEPWPYAKPLVVLSTTMQDADIPERLRGRVRRMAGPPGEILARLDADGWRRAYVDGGDTIRRFLEAGCIADIVVSRLPVLIGQGRPLFGPREADLWLEHEETRAFPGGLVQSRYRVPAPRAAS